MRSITRGDLTAALAIYNQILAEREKLARGLPEAIVQQRDLIPIHCSIAELLASPLDMNLNQPDAALPHLRQAEALAVRLAVANPKNARGQKDLAFVYRRMAAIQMEAKPRAAAELWRKSVAIIDAQLQAGAVDLEYRQDLALSFWGLGAALDRTKDSGAARRAADAAIDIQQALV